MKTKTLDNISFHDSFLENIEKRNNAIICSLSHIDVLPYCEANKFKKAKKTSRASLIFYDVEDLIFEGYDSKMQKYENVEFESILSEIIGSEINSLNIAEKNKAELLLVSLHTLVKMTFLFDKTEVLWDYYIGDAWFEKE